MPKLLSQSEIDAFHRDGFVSPVRAMAEERALAGMVSGKPPTGA